MVNSKVRTIQYACLLLSVLLHVLLFMTFSAVFTFSPKPLPKVSEEYLPAYLDQSHNQQAMETQSGSAVQSQPLATPKKMQTAENGIEKPIPIAKTTPTPAEKRAAMHQLNQAMDVRAPDEGDPVHMIGDKNKAVQPLLKLLGISLTHHLRYPKSAVDFNIKGTAVLGFTLYPDGHITNIELLQSSHAGVLDQAAVNALAAVSPLKDTSRFVKKPQYMVIGIMFG